MKSTRAAFGLMIASGFAGLGYQIVWTQQAALWLGHEAAAVLAVVTAFFGGLALGALALGQRIERSPRPERWYAACELTIALWSLALALLMAPVSAGLLEFTGAQPSLVWQWAVAFFGSLLLLLPATAAMGATLPAMARVLAQSTRTGQPRHRVAALYACNTLGAVIGVLASAFWLVPELGLARTAGLCAVLNLLCAAAALTLTAVAQHHTAGSPAALPVQAPALQAAQKPAQKRALATLTATGLLGIGYEVLVVRVISQVTENTVYTFAVLLAVYLVGTALGAAAYQHWLNRQLSGLISGRGGLQRAPLEAAALRDRLLCLLAAACLLGTLSLWGAEHTLQFMSRQLGAGMGSALAAEAALALAAFALPTLVMGALFSHLSTSASIDTENKGRAGERIRISFSLALGFNTLGAAAAPLLFGVLVVPALGAKVALLLIAAGYLALVSGRAWGRPQAWGVAAAGLALMVWTPPLIFVDVPEGGHIVSYREGAMAAVSVVEDSRGVARLRIDNRQQEGSSASQFADARQALLPLLLHPGPERALFLGLGTGVTASAAAADPRVRVEAVELLPEVIAASAYFTAQPANELNAGAIDNSRPRPQLHMMAADARRFMKATSARYDVIVSDNFHPARSGSGSLYTVEHFQAVQARLTGSGLFCQWLPLHQLDLETLRSIVQSFIAVYPGAWAMLATNSLETPVLGLVGRADGGRPAGHFDLDLERLQQRLADTVLPQPLADFGLNDEFDVLGSFIAGPQALKRFAGNAPRNTDDHPVVAYRAPRITYAPDSLPRDRLLALLQWLHANPADAANPAQLIAANSPPAWGQRLSAYWTARDQFIEAGRNVRAAADVKAMLAHVRQPLLSVLRTSPDFRPAYDPLLRMAAALASTDEPAAQALLAELIQAQPLRPEAAQALRQLGQPTR